MVLLMCVFKFIIHNWISENQKLFVLFIREKTNLPKGKRCGKLTGQIKYTKANTKKQLRGKIFSTYQTKKVRKGDTLKVNTFGLTWSDA